MSFRDEYSEVIGSATFALCEIAQWLEGAKAIVDSKALDHVSLLFKSPNPCARMWTCFLVARFAHHGLDVPAVLKLEPSLQLLSLLRCANRSHPFTM
jgi:hypothetical protein